MVLIYHLALVLPIKCRHFDLVYCSCAKYQRRATILPTTKEEANMSKHYIPVPTSKTTYYEPKTEEERDALFDEMQVGDMLYNKWVFNGLWYTMGLLVKNDPTSKCLLPNSLLDEPLPSLTRWGIARMNYLKEHRNFQAAQYGTIGLHKHCLEVEEQAKQKRKHDDCHSQRPSESCNRKRQSPRLNGLGCPHEQFPSKHSRNNLFRPYLLLTKIAK